MITTAGALSLFLLDPQSTLEQVWAGLSVLVCCAVAVRFSRLRVVVASDRLRVVNFFWSTSVRWEEVERFEIDRGDWSPSIHAFIVRGDGSRVPITALQARWAQSVERARRKGAAARKIAELNRLLATRRGQEPWPPLPLPRRVALHGRSVLQAAVGCAVTVAIIVGGLAYPGFGHAWGWLWPVGVAVTLWGLVRLARVRVRADETGLTLVGWMRTRRLAWRDLERFETASCWWPTALRVVVKCRDGRRIPAKPLTSWLGWRRGLARQAAELQEILDDRRRGQREVPGPKPAQA